MRAGTETELGVGGAQSAQCSGEGGFCVCRCTDGSAPGEGKEESCGKKGGGFSWGNGAVLEGWGCPGGGGLSWKDGSHRKGGNVL